MSHRITHWILTVFVLSPLTRGTLLASGVSLHKRDAVVWSQTVVINGNCGPAFDRSGALSVNGVSVPFVVATPADTFSVPIRIGEGLTTVVARVDSAGVPVCSDTLRLTLGYNVRPDILAHPTVTGRSVVLHASTVSNEDSSSLTFLWTADAANPAVLTLGNPMDSVASCNVPAGAPEGEYYFTVRVLSSHGDTVRARTLVTVDSAVVRSFDIIRDHARWIDTAAVYEISPHFFVQDGTFQDIIDKLDDLSDLGITAIWLQPITKTIEPYQGYHVTDYFAIRPDFGTEADFRRLVEAAHGRGMKVLLDIVPNHTSLQHPWAQDVVAYGTQSHYYDFYQHTISSGAYAAYERITTIGSIPFVIYFYPTLMNLNFASGEVRRMMLEAGRHWVEEFDIDGYRADMVWAAYDHNPEFFKEWTSALKRLKPDILLLAEDSWTFAGPRPASPFAEGFHAGYDWNADWKWNWNGVGFGSVNPNVALLESSLTNGGQGVPEMGKILRFGENNDVSRLMQSYGEAGSRLVDALVFTTSGIPLIYNGQEIGATAHPYSGTPIFRANASIPSQDAFGLFPYLRQLGEMRRHYPAFVGDSLEITPSRPTTTVLAYRRWAGSQNIFCLANLSGSAVSAHIQIPVARLVLDPARTYFFTDLLTGDVYPRTPQYMADMRVPLNATSMRVLLLDTAAVTGIAPTAGLTAPLDFALAQNYPNPFNPSTRLAYTVGGVRNQESGFSLVRLAVYDILGREVAVLVHERQPAGHYEVTFDGSRLSSGVYFYRLQAGNLSLVKKMVLVR